MLSFIQTQLTDEYNLQRVCVPEACSTEMNGEQPEATCPIFMSKEFYRPVESDK